MWKALTSQPVPRRPRLPPGTRIYAVGDIHGRADLLAKLFERIDADLKSSPVANAMQIFLGDYIDRGPDSRLVVDMLIARQSQKGVILLKGNHEDCALQFLMDPATLLSWRKIGGLNTVLSYGVTSKRGNGLHAHHEMASELQQAMPESHKDFLGNLRLSFDCGDFFFVHAGVRPGVQLQDQSPDDLLWIREDFLLHEGDFGKVVVHGHTPVNDPEILPNRINIDTGAFATGRLTCLVLEDDQLRFL